MPSRFTYVTGFPAGSANHKSPGEFSLAYKILYVLTLRNRIWLLALILALVFVTQIGERPTVACFALLIVLTVWLGAQVIFLLCNMMTPPHTGPLDSS